MASNDLAFLACIFVACICLSRKMAMLVSLIARRTKLPCPHCGARCIDAGQSDYFIPTIARHTCPKCGGRYHRPLRKGLALLFCFLGLLLLIWGLVPEPWCYLLFPAECLAMLLVGVLSYRPEAVMEPNRADATNLPSAGPKS